MKKGYRVIDMDTHVGPSFDVLCEYVDPSFRPRLPELEKYRQKDGVNIAVAPYQWTRYAGQKPDTKPETIPGGPVGWSANSRPTSRNHHAAPRPGISDKDSDARIQDMDWEGRDIDLMYPGNWAPPIMILDQDVQKGLYSAYHRYIKDYSSRDTGRLKSIALLPCSDIEWSITELKSIADEKWLAGVWLMLTDGMPIDDPDLVPLYEVLNEYHIPVVAQRFCPC